MKRFLTIALAVLLFMLPSCSWNLEDDVTDKVTQDISNIPSDGAFLNEIERRYLTNQQTRKGLWLEPF